MGAAGAGLDSPLEGFAGRCGVGATLASELSYPGRRGATPSSLRGSCKVRRACGYARGAARLFRGRRDCARREAEAGIHWSSERLACVQRLWRASCCAGFGALSPCGGRVSSY